MKESAETYFAGFSIYTHMAHFVGKILHIRPNEILDTWGVPELIVAYGEYANELADRNYRQWKDLSPETRSKTEKPPKYIVRFIGIDEMGEEDG